MKKAIYILVASLLVCFQIKAQTIGWSELGGENSLAANNAIYCVCSDNSGNIYAAGRFSNDSEKCYVAKYNGTSWSELGGLNGLAANNVIYSICSDNLGNIYAAGTFTNSSHKYYVAKYNGTSWSELGGMNSLAANNVINTICCDAARNVYAGGNFTTDSGKYYIAIYNGSEWSAFGGINNLVSQGGSYSLCSDALGNIYTTAGLTTGGLQYVAESDGVSWSQLGSGFDGVINTLCTDTAGNIYAAGDFRTSEVGTYYVGKYHGGSWSELGGADLGANSWILSICTDALGNIYAAGQFTNGGSNTSGKEYVAKYNGTAWTELGGTNGLAANGWINGICSDLAGGNIYAAGYFRNASNNYYVAKYGTVTGISEIGSGGSMNLFPNPTNNVVTISTGNIISNANIKVYNITGQAVTEKNNQAGNKFAIDLTNQVPGIYFIEVREEENVWVGKVVKTE